MALGDMENRAAKMLDCGPVEINGNGASAPRRFGVFEVDLRSGELRRNGVKVKLQEQPLQVLAQLLERPGEVVTREDLRKHLWPADTFVDFDHSLNAAIRRLRDALGDSAENPTFVETVARRGYRFLAPVSIPPANGLAVLTPAPVDSVPAEPRKRHPWWIAAAAVGFVLLILGLALGFFLAPHDAAPLRVTQLTANPINDPVRLAAISRDGRYLAFSDESGFFLRQIDTGETHAVTLPDGFVATSLSWVPDSVHLIVSLNAQGRESSLWELSALGGSARKLVEDGHLPAVSPDGKEIAFLAGKPMRQRIWLGRFDGTPPREFLGEDGDLFGGITWSPDSRKIAYTTAKFAYGNGVKASMDVVDVPQPSSYDVVHPASVMSLSGLEGPLAWAPDGRLIYALAEPRPRQMDSNLWSMRLNRQMQPQGAPQRLTNDQGVVSSVTTSGDTHRILYVKAVPEPDVYVGKLDSSGNLSEPQRLTLDDRQDVPFDWTSDNKQVIFMSDRTGAFNIYKQSQDQAVPDLVVSNNQQAAQPRLSPDGKQLIYVVYPNWGDSNYEVPLMRVPLAGGAPQQLARANWISNHQCARAPAAVCLYSVVGDRDVTFFSFDPMQGHSKQVYQLKDDLVQVYNWSLAPDGSTLAITKGKWGDEEIRIHLVSLTGGPEKWLNVTGWTGLASLDWAADSKGFWAASSGDRENALLHIDLRGNARAVWRPNTLNIGWAIPSRDGKSLALHVNSDSANVWMLERP
jgi:Tol biopolymer transport system component/DNA-binding winged helix-turn-helix (wHTH) protein